MNLAAADAVAQYMLKDEQRADDPLRTMHVALVLSALCMILWMLPAGLWSIQGPDESRYVMVAREWLAGPHGIGLTLMGEPYDQKPPLPFWLSAFMLAANGGEITSWGVRCFPVLLGTAAVIGTWLIGRRHLSDRAGIIAALVLMTSAQWMDNVPSAELNVMFAGWLVLSLACWFVRPAGLMSWGRAGAMWLLLAAAFFTKGPLALLIVVFTLGAECAVRRSIAPLREARALPGAILVGALIGGWLMAQRAAVSSTFVENQVVGQTVDRFLHGDHAEPPWYYLPRLFTTIMAPWALLLIPMGIGMWRSRTTLPPFVRVIVWGWIGLPFLVLMLAVGKRESYLLPILPGFALLLGRYLDRWFADGGTAPRLARFAGVVSGVAVLGFALLATIHLLWPQELLDRDFQFRSWQLVPLATLAALFLANGVWCWTRATVPHAAFVGIFLLVFLAGQTSFVIINPARDEARSSRSFSAKVDRLIVARGLSNKVGLIDRASKPEYSVYANYTCQRLESKVLESPGPRVLPDVLLTREQDWKDVEAKHAALAAEGFTRLETSPAAGEELTIYVRDRRPSQTPLGEGAE